MFEMAFMMKLVETPVSDWKVLEEMSGWLKHAPGRIFNQKKRAEKQVFNINI